jgi:hypothetical protein
MWVPAAQYNVEKHPLGLIDTFADEMAAFSSKFPRAVHVLPLHALRGVLEDRALLAKSELLCRTTAAVRSTTSQTDAALGLSDYVHLYLLKENSRWEKIPILATQLLKGVGAPFPHVGIETGTAPFADDDCTLCLWNAAVSRPRVSGHCQGGNWTRGTDSARILQVWRSFREQRPNARVARGYWNHPIQIPTLHGDQIKLELSLLSRASGGMPELLLRSPVRIDNRLKLWVFSREDMEALRALREPLQLSGMSLGIHSLEGYDCQSHDTGIWRSRIESYFAGQAPFPADLNFDRKR